MYRQLGGPKPADQKWIEAELRAVEAAFAKTEPAPTVITLVDAATISINAGRRARAFRVTLAGNRTLANPTGLTSGQWLYVRIKQDGTGSRTLAYGSMYKFPGGVVPTLTTTAAASDLLACQYDATDNTLFCELTKDYR